MIRLESKTMDKDEKEICITQIIIAKRLGTNINMSFGIYKVYKIFLQWLRAKDQDGQDTSFMEERENCHNQNMRVLISKADDYYVNQRRVERTKFKKDIVSLKATFKFKEGYTFNGTTFQRT